MSSTTYCNKCSKKKTVECKEWLNGWLMGSRPKGFEEVESRFDLCEGCSKKLFKILKTFFQ